MLLSLVLVRLLVDGRRVRHRPRRRLPRVPRLDPAHRRPLALKHPQLAIGVSSQSHRGSSRRMATNIAPIVTKTLKNF